MRNIIHLGLGTLGCLALITISLAQSDRARDTQQTDRVVVGTSLVSVNVIVTDGKGRYVKGLGRDQFEVYDDQARQQIAHFSADASPVSLGIVCEIHESATEKTRAMLSAIKEFTATLSDRDDFFFVAFSEHGSVTTEFVPRVDQVVGHLQFVKPGGPSALYDAVYLGAERLQGARNLKKALLVISDGQDNHSRYTYKQLRNRLRTFDAQIYTIGIADPVTDRFAGYGRWVFEDITRQTGRRTFLLNSDAALGRAVLTELSRASGGTTYIPQTESEPELTGICTQIAFELRQQYTLGFYPDRVGNGRWHRLRVRLGNPAGSSSVTLSYREGYQISGS